MKLHFDVEGKQYATAGEASSKVKEVLKKIGVKPELIRKIAIAMYEAEINMVIHANGGTIDVDIMPDKIYICLKDVGPGIPDIDLAMQEGYSTASEEARKLGFGAGMGLPNMKKFADDLKITSVVGKGTTVEITVNL